MSSSNIDSRIRYILVGLLLASGLLSVSIVGYMYTYAETWGDCLSYLPFVHLFNLAVLGIIQIGTAVWVYIKLP